MKPPSIINAIWTGDRRFDVAPPGGVSSRIDGDGKTGPGPFQMLLGALAACAAVDVLDILTKRRTPAERLSVTVTGERTQGVPAYLTRARVEYTVDGAGIDRESAERAVDLAISKYCSVRSSLDPRIPVVISVTLNGEPGTDKVTHGVRG